MTNYFNGYGQTQRPNNEILAVPVHGEVGAQNYPVASGNTCKRVTVAEVYRR